MPSWSGLRLAGVALVAVCSGACALTREVAVTLATNTEQLAPPHPCAGGNHPPLLIIALDGVDRRLLYPMLERNELPEFSRLLGGGQGQALPHAYFDRSVVATFPSVTGAGWAAVFTGKPPAENGIPGDEFFIRQYHYFAAPIPATTDDPRTALAVYTDGYADHLLTAPTVYERIRASEPQVCIWVVMSHFHGGADVFLHTRTAILADPPLARVGRFLSGRAPRHPWADLDQSGMEVLEDHLRQYPAPDILTVYLVGADVYTHQAREGADAARQGYLHDVIDPALGRLRRALRSRQALAHRYVLVTSDHGMSDVPNDELHALATENGPPAVVTGAGFRLRPFEVETTETDYQAVLTYQGAAAFVYVADRSTCAAAGTACDWRLPARFQQDIEPMAEAFFQANGSGRWSAKLQHALDLILVRRPSAGGESRFEVYLGAGRTETLEQYLGAHPHPSYVDLPSRVRDLTQGPAGDRAGDVILLTHSGDRVDPADRYYFSRPQYAEHGSPSERDSDVSLIVAHPELTTDAIRARVQGALGPDPQQFQIGELIVQLRLGATR